MGGLQRRPVDELIDDRLPSVSMVMELRLSPWPPVCVEVQTAPLLRNLTTKLPSDCRVAVALAAMRY